MNILADVGLYLYLYIALVIFLAGLVHGSIGLGFPMVATPLIAIFLDVRIAILVTLIPTVAVNIASIWGGEDYRNSLSEYKTLFIFVFSGSVIGSIMLAFLDPSPFRLALALLIVLYLWASLSNTLSPGWIGSAHVAAMIVFGTLAGISGGITNVMIAILLIYFISLDIARSKMIPIVNTCFLIGKLTQITVLVIAGVAGFGLLVNTAPLAAIALIALFLGQKLAHRISKEFYTRVLYGLLFGLACVLFVQFFLSL